MLSAFKIDFAAREFAWAVLGGFVLMFALRRAVHQFHRKLRAISQYPILPAVALAMVMFGIQFVVAERFGWPIPALHDEFSYLLAADTFASGRATNPTHPAWEFLETYHVLSQPTMQSKYPPGNGLTLAFGQVLTGQPIVGVWICLSLAAGLTFWMLHGWYSTVWCVLGTAVLICNWPLTRLWGQTYYGGGPALVGGLLVFGAFARLQRHPDFLHACLFSLGLIALSVTRPYEGLLTSLPLLILLAVRICKSSGTERRHWLMRTVLPGSLLLAAGFAALCWFHWKVTGSPWLWPYRVYEATYTRRTTAFNTLFSFTDLGARERTIPSLEYGSSAAMANLAETKPVVFAAWKVVRQWWFHIGILATIPFGLAIGHLFHRRIRKRDTNEKLRRNPVQLALITSAIVGLAILLQRTAGHPHYAAPVQPLLLFITVNGLRLLRTLRVRGHRIGPDLVSWFTWSLMLFFVLPLLTGTNRPGIRRWSLERARIQAELEQRPRPQLAIVRYGAKHSMHEEWIYNRADIDGARVVWARDLGPKQTARLLDLFPDREVWIIRPDLERVDVVPYRLKTAKSP